MRRSVLQYRLGDRRCDPAACTLQLMQAVLEDGIRTLLGRNVATRGGRAARRWQEEFLWLTSRDRSHPFAFERICEALDIHPERLRRRTLAETRHAAPMAVTYSLADPRATRP
jgi:hypothetical protein